MCSFLCAVTRSFVPRYLHDACSKTEIRSLDQPDWCTVDCRHLVSFCILPRLSKQSLFRAGTA